MQKEMTAQEGEALMLTKEFVNQMLAEVDVIRWNGEHMVEISVGTTTVMVVVYPSETDTTLFHIPVWYGDHLKKHLTAIGYENARKIAVGELLRGMILLG